MQGMVSDKTFHLKWNNHLQNLSQLFTTIYSSSALADVTLSCRDGTLKAHKLVLSACSPYFEQIFKDNPCQHPIVILKGIPFSEINLLVEFMYKGSVDVQELDLQSLMHTAAELEIRGLAYEARDSAAQLLNVNLEYPTYPQTPLASASQYAQQTRTDVERLKQIHMYQQSMMRAEEMRRRRRDDPPTTHTAVNNILAAAAREMEEARHMGARQGVVMHAEQEHATATATSEVKRDPDEAGKKRPSILSPEDEKLRVKKKMTVRFQDDAPDKERTRLVSPVPDRHLKITSVRSMTGNEPKAEGETKPGGGGGGIKVVPMAMLKANNDHGDESDEKAAGSEDEETDSNGSVSDSAANESQGRPHVCDICDQRFHRSTHLSRHRLTHTGERPFTCGGCGRSFARSDKLRVHTKICEKEDPTVDMNMSGESNKRESNSEMMSGMVRMSHRESGHLLFTAGGDVMLPRTNPVLLNSTLEPLTNEIQPGDLVEPVRRGRGRPRKTPLPLTPKVQKRRGRPPKTSLDMEGCVLTSGAVGPTAPLSVSGAQLMLKRRRGRPPKTYHMSRPTMPDGRPNENYNATNLPFGDFAYLTEMMYNPLAFNYGAVTVEPDRSVDGDHSADHSGVTETSHDRTIDVSDSSTEEEGSSHSRVEPEESVPPVAMETQVMTVGDCQIVKLPPNAPTAASPGADGDGNENAASANGDDKAEQVVDNSQVPTSTSSGAVTITPISAVGDCTVRPVDNNT